MADVYEQNLPQKTNLTTNDYVRVVGSDDVSYKQPLSDVAQKTIENYAGSTLAGSTQSVKGAIDGLKSQDTNLQAQINQLVAPTGTAPNPAEIENARIGADNVTYTTLGDAIRTQVTDLKSDLSDAVDTLDAYKVAQPLDENNQPTDGTDGQLLRTKGDGSTAWVDEGLPTDEQTTQAVSDWLDAHPEATTTVQDHSLTYEKLVVGTLGYVTPEMFGAKGDGVTDDTDAMQAAINNGKVVILSNKTYKVSKITITSKGTSIIGSGSARTTIKSQNGIELRTATNTKLKGFTLWSGLDLATPRTSNDGTGLYLNKSDEGTSITREQFDDIIISGYYIGFYSDGFWTVEIRNFRIDYCYTAFSFTTGFGGNFTNCYFTSSNKILIHLYQKRCTLVFNSCNFGISNTDAFVFDDAEDSTLLFNSCNLECDSAVDGSSGSSYIFYAEKGTFVFNSCVFWSNISNASVYFFRGNNGTRFLLNQCSRHLYGGLYSSNWFNSANSEITDIDGVGSIPCFDIRSASPSQYTTGTVYYDTNDSSLKIRHDGAWKRIGTGTVFSASQPSDNVGQLWVNNTDVFMQLANKGYTPLTCIVSGSQPSIYNVGTLWFDTSNNVLKVRANGQWNTI